MRGSVVKRGKTYSIVFEVEDTKTGKKKQKWEGGYKTKKEAEKAVGEAVYKIQNGTYILPETTTTKEYLKDWYKVYVEPNLEQTTADGYNVNIEKHIIPYIGDIPLQKLRAANIQDLYNQLKEKGNTKNGGTLSGKSILYVHRVLRQALQHAVRNQVISRNPADDVKSPSVEKYHSEIFDSKEVNTLLKIVKDSEYEIPITLSAIIGLRRGEALGLKWSDVDWKNTNITIRNQLVPTSKGVIDKKPKSEGSIRTIPIPPTVVALLKNQRLTQLKNKVALGEEYIKNDLVSCHVNGSNIDPSNFSKVFSKILEVNGLKHIRYHDLRHSAATNMLMNGIDIKTVSTILGHSTISITLEIYAHVLDSMKRDAVNKMEAVIYKIEPDGEKKELDIVNEQLQA